MELEYFSNSVIIICKKQKVYGNELNKMYWKIAWVRSWSEWKMHNLKKKTFIRGNCPNVDAVVKRQ